MADVAIVGASVAGLCCALRLREIGIPFQIFEAAATPGGRLRSTVVDGFRIDRFFQPLLTALPEVERTLDYPPLDLRPLRRTILIRSEDRFYRCALPGRTLRANLHVLFNPISSAGDKLRLFSLMKKVISGSPADLLAKPEGLTLDLLRWHGFNESTIDRLFRPLLSVFFLERDLVTSSRLFRVVIRALVTGDWAIPRSGMGAIIDQLIGRLPSDCIRVGAKIERVEPGQMFLDGGEPIAARAIVVATNAPEAGRLLGDRIRIPAMRSVTTFYFAAEKSPVGEPILVLNSGRGPINHLAVLSDITPDCAPAGAALVSVSMLGSDESRLPDVIDQSTHWFGAAARHWRHVATITERNALPDQTAPALDPPERPVELGDALFVCGDHRETATHDGAMASGWRAAQAVAEALAG